MQVLEQKSVSLCTRHHRKRIEGREIGRDQCSQAHQTDRGSNERVRKCNECCTTSNAPPAKNVCPVTVSLLLFQESLLQHVNISLHLKPEGRANAVCTFLSIFQANVAVSAIR